MRARLCSTFTFFFFSPSPGLIKDQCLRITECGPGLKEKEKEKRMRVRSLNDIQSHEVRDRSRTISSSTNCASISLAANPKDNKRPRNEYTICVAVHYL